MPGDLTGRVALLTGAAHGVGAASAQALAARGARVVITYRTRAAEAAEVVDRCVAFGGEALALPLDVTDDAACTHAVAAAVDAFGGVDYLVNNASRRVFVGQGDLALLDRKDFLGTFDVDVVGAYQVTRAAEAALRRSRGSVVNVSAWAGVAGVGSSMAFAAAKGALNTLTLALARHLAPEVRVNAVCPGIVRTATLRDGLGPERYAAILARGESRSPLRESSAPEDLAASIVWLLADARQVTGDIHLANAGLHLA